MLINPIASGSSGNAYYISDGQSSLLLDAGIPLAQIQAGCGYKVSQLSGCLVTHGHGDHVKAAKALARMGVNIYTSQGTADMANLTGHRICTVRALESFHAGTFEVLPFDVEHDVPEPLGFLIRSTVTGEKVLYFTDTVYIKYTFIGLIIDDIGSEQPTEWGVSKIFAIINARYEGYMPTIITTNYSGPELVQRMTPESGDSRNAEKTLDRLKETCVGIDMTWESWRAK